MPRTSRTLPARAALLALVALVLLPPGCGGPPPLALTPRPLKLAHDGFEVWDAAVLDPDHDADMDVIALTEETIYYMEHIEGGWLPATPGTGLGSLPSGRGLHPQGPEGLDFLVDRDGVLARLAYTGIGSWTEQEEPGYGAPPDRTLTVAFDLDGDGLLDRATADDRRVRIERRRADGTFTDVTRVVGADGLVLPSPARRLIGADLEGDGDADLLVVGGRVFVLINNGGVLPADD